MITVDAELTKSLMSRPGGIDSRSDVGHVMRATGINAVTLPDGTSGLAWDHGNGTWGVLTREGGIDRPVSGGAQWFSGRIEPELGQGFMTTVPRTLWDALREALVMPCPILEDGSVMDGRVADAIRAEELLAPENAAPALGM